MDTFLVVIASPGSSALDPEFVNRIHSLGPGEPLRWLAHGECFELPIKNQSDVYRRASELLENRPVDLALVPAAGRRKRLLVADMDSTMIAQECIDELGAAAGAGDKVAAITARAMRGELDFAGSLRERLALMAGLDASVVPNLLSAVRYTPGGHRLVATMKAAGAYAALVSGGFTQFTGHVAASLGFDEHRANELLIEHGKLTGLLNEPVLGRDAKVHTLIELTQKLGLDSSQTLAVGDGANDIDMLKTAGLGVAFHAKPAVREAAQVRIDHGDLTSLLYLQGFSKAEFASNSS